MGKATRWYVSAGTLLLSMANIVVAQKPGPPQEAASTPAVANTVLERVLTQRSQGGTDAAAPPGERSHGQGVLLSGMIAEWRVTGDGRLFRYVKAAADRTADAAATTHNDAQPRASASQPDSFGLGRSLVVLYRVLQQPRYYLAAKTLHDTLLEQLKSKGYSAWDGARHGDGGPGQVRLESAYTAAPFLTNYARTFDQPGDMDIVAGQLLLMDARLRNHQRGQLQRGPDEPGRASRADRHSGVSAEVPSSDLGWYVMALVDVLERMPVTDPQRAALEDVAHRQLQNVAHYQDSSSGLWRQVMDKPASRGNDLEASASCMFVYALAKAIRLDLLPLSYEANVTHAWAGIQSHFVKPDGTLSGTVTAADASAASAHSGTADHNFSGPVVNNDPEVVGVYLLAHSEMLQHERAGDLLRRAHGRTVLVDSWFNDDKRRSIDGHEEFFHYKWNDDSDSGYSFFARMFQQYGMRTETLDHAPHAEDLRGVDVYVIASPDNAATSRYPHYIDKESADVIDAWVKAGGVLLLMENDSEHADQDHLDLLSDRFGVHFNAVTRNREIGNDYSTTLVKVPAGAGGIFHHDYIALEKGTCTIIASGSAKSIVSDGGDSMMAVAYPGRGVVFANVDPWLYNEYTDGRKDPLGEQNFAAGQELVRWVVHEAVTH